MKCLKRLLIITVVAVSCDALAQHGSSTALLRASRTTIQPVEDVDGSLEEYMQLPASQYSCVPMPLNSSLNRVAGTADQFRLLVPPMKLKSPGVPEVEVRPLMMASVNVRKDCVFITSNSCQIRGSKIIEDLKINDFFDFKVEICLTWENGSPASSINKTRSPLSPSITARSEIEVDLEPPGLFAFVPRRIIEAVGSRAIDVTLGALQKNFMKSLGSDFERWSVDDNYREQRKQLELNIAAEGQLQTNEDETLMKYLKR
mmetsp:Transcript_12705/g.18733  ORF Transcript_12705/g.18733 Transcript_12705/m.18733 type:complete len:259 (-) Transcript_12705:59-835(-)